jgi:hypothetical protein
MCPSEWFASSIVLLTILDKGKKFNARKETATTEEYYGIKIFRFYIVSHPSLFNTSGVLSPC